MTGQVRSSNNQWERANLSVKLERDALGTDPADLVKSK